MTKGPCRSAIILFLALHAAGCVQPVRRVSMDESFLKQESGRRAWRKVAVLPFAGDPVFRRTAAEWLAFRLRKLGIFEVVDPSLAEIELGRGGIVVGDAVLPAAVTQRAGRLLGVDGVVFGSAQPPAPRSPGSAAVRAGVVDVETGKVIADAVMRDPRWGQYGRQAVMGGVDAVAADLGPLLRAAAGGAWTPAPRNEGDGRAPTGDEITGVRR